MSYSIKDYPHLVTLIITDGYGMSMVSDNYSGRVFRIEFTKLIR